MHEFNHLARKMYIGRLMTTQEIRGTIEAYPKDTEKMEWFLVCKLQMESKQVASCFKWLNRPGGKVAKMFKQKKKKKKAKAKYGKQKNVPLNHPSVKDLLPIRKCGHRVAHSCQFLHGLPRGERAILPISGHSWQGGGGGGMYLWLI